MPDLDDVLAAAEGARARSFAAAAMPDDALVTLGGFVRGRRVRRRAVQAVVAVPVVAMLAAGAWLTLGHDPDPVPPVTQSPSPTTSPSPTETSTPGPDAGLPALEPLPDGLLEQAGPGWVLGIYQPTDTQYVDVPPYSQVVVLTRPDGPVFEVVRVDPTADLPAGMSWRDLELRYWEPGTTTAMVTALYPEAASGDGSAYYPLYDLDLTTGALSLSTQDLGIAPGDPGPVLVTVVNGRAVWLDLAGGGKRLLVGDGSVDVPSTTWAVQASPDGRYLLVGDRTVVDLDRLEVVGHLPWAGSEFCDPVSWWTADQVLARCTDADPLPADPASADAPVLATLHPRLESFAVADLTSGSAAGTPVRDLGADDPWPELTDAYLADHRVALGSWQTVGDSPLGQACSLPYLLDGSDLRSLPVPDGRAGVGVSRISAADGRVYVATMPMCAGSGADTTLGLGAVEPQADGSFFSTLIGPPTGPPPVGDRWLDGLTSWLVGR